MYSAKRITLTSLVTLAALSWTHLGHAEEASASTPAPGGVAAMPSPGPSPAVPEPASIRHSPFGSKPLPAAALAARRGGDRVFNDAQLKGVVADNQVSNTTTGMNVISEGAFAGSGGIATVIQNTGNNVLIQNATIVNVQLK